MAGAMRIDPVEETEDVDDQFEMSLEYLPDPVQCVEPPQMASHAATGEERGSAGLRMRMEEGFTPGGYRYRTRSRTGSLGCGKLMPPSNESKRGKNEVISETEAGGGDGTVKSAAQCGSVKLAANCSASGPFILRFTNSLIIIIIISRECNPGTRKLG